MTGWVKTVFMLGAGVGVPAVVVAATGDRPAVSRLVIAQDLAPPAGDPLRAACSIVNIQGSIAAGYLAWPVPDAGMAIYFDPEGTGAAGDPGCGANPYSFLIEDVDLTFADSSMFTGGESGPGTLEFSVAINCPNEDGEPCSEPGTELFRSDTITMTVPPEGELREFNVAIDVCVDGPFFVIVHYETWSGDADKVPSLLWDDVTRPRCRQYITGDGGLSWTDHEDYFTSGDTGWALVTVNGNTQDSCGPSGNCGGPPPVGPCCLPDGSCVNSRTPGECADLDGMWMGADLFCFQVECPQPPPGACCLEDASCDDVDEFVCAETAGSMWLGADTECGADCDDDGAADICEIEMGLAEDCQPNGVPDNCDIADGTSADINFNGVPDECECRSGDGDANGDFFVDLADWAVMGGCLDGPMVYRADGCEDVDMDGDCDVDLADAQRFQLAFNQFTQTEIFRVELAGNSLDTYPYFEYVKAFNENATVEVALDPTRYPDIVGLTCDIYVVEAKTTAGWIADPSLTDVRPDGPQTETFGGTTIQENTFLVADPFDLDADAGLGLGVGYDVVLDCDRDGELTFGDYIDGLGNEAGLYAVHDTSAPGPLSVVEIPTYNVGEVFGIPTGFTLEDIYYPSNIEDFDEVPMVVISHGNGHNYQWYDHLGNHFGSYGYIVMSHQNATGAGIDACSLTTCGHTDAFISQLSSIGGGILDGHVDTSRIVWIGHSRGAEGVAMAYDRIAVSHTYSPTFYSVDSIILVSSMLPTDFYGAGLTTGISNPRDANYHLWTASGDADVRGVPWSDVAQTFHLHDRATRFRHSTVVQGTGHAWFHDGGGPSVQTGPCPIGEENTHLIQQGMFLPLIKYYAEGNIPATDFFWRQYEHFRPIGVGTGGFCSASQGDAIVVNNTYRNGADGSRFVIDDYQSESSSAVSSSGGAVTFTVTNLNEGRLDDANATFTWTSADPMNGMTYGAARDDTRGVVFDWNGTDRYYEWEIVPEGRDFTGYNYLTFRACQGTRHPYTIAELGDVTFNVTLRDAFGTTASINIGAYGGGIEEPYQRSGAGDGVGWGNEFETIRIRLTDFLTNGTGLDLTNIEALRLDVGPSFGSNEARLGVDEVALTKDNPPFFIPLSIDVPSPPILLSSTEPTTFAVEINPGTDDLVDGTAMLHYRYEGGAFLSAPLTLVSGSLYEATLPTPECDDTPAFYVSAEGAVTGEVTDPPGGASAPYTADVGVLVVYFDDDFETDHGWTVVNDPSLSTGAWERGVPFASGDPAGQGDPQEDYDGSGQCYVTGNGPGLDVDGGPTRLISPNIDLSSAQDPTLRYARWFVNIEDDPTDFDFFDVELSDDGGSTWVLVEHTGHDPPWKLREVRVLDYVSLTSQVRMRVTADDQGFSRTEGGVDAVNVFDIICEP